MIRIVDEELFKAYKDASHFDAIIEEVIFPVSTSEVSEAVRYAYEKNLAVYVFGAGSGLSGAANAIGGIVIDTILMDKFEIYEDDMYVIAEPGARLSEVNAQLMKRGLWIPIDPGSYEFVTIGGIVSTNASGLRAVKYGNTANYVRAVEVVDGRGRVFWFGNRYVRRSSSAPVISKLLVGSEGTLGIITKVVMDVLPLPEYRESVVINYESEELALSDVPRIVRLIPSALEFLDTISANAIGFENPILIVEFDGTEADVKSRIERLRRLVKGRIEEKENIWQRRKLLGPTLNKIRGARTDWDLAVPISKLVHVVKTVREEASRRGLEVAIFGHVGDGILHLTFLHEPERWREVEEVGGEIVCHIISKFGGSITGEHGVGMAKLRYVKCEELPTSFLKELKMVMDPHLILNPGKKIPF